MTSLPPRADPGTAAKQAFAAGRAAFNQGQFFAAHESWEEVWRVSSGMARTAIQGLIQIAAGLHHLHRDRAGPAARLVDKGVRKLHLAAADLSSDLSSDFFSARPSELSSDRRVGHDVASHPDPLAELLAELQLDVFAGAITRLMDGCRARPDERVAPRSPSTVVVPRL